MLQSTQGLPNHGLLMVALFVLGQKRHGPLSCFHCSVLFPVFETGFVTLVSCKVSHPVSKQINDQDIITWFWIWYQTLGWKIRVWHALIVKLSAAEYLPIAMLVDQFILRKRFVSHTMTNIRYPSIPQFFRQFRYLNTVGYLTLVYQR